MIEQHQYGRGLKMGEKINKNYNTIASSKGIKIEHIQEYFEPLCAYAIAIGRKNLNNKSIINDRYSLIITPVPTGELLIGQMAVAKCEESNDENFFVHNYILSSSEKNRYVKMPEKIFGVTKFDVECKENQSTELSVLAGIPYQESNPYFRDKEGLLSKLKLDELVFNKIIQAILVSVN